MIAQTDKTNASCQADGSTIFQKPVSLIYLYLYYFRDLPTN